MTPARIEPATFRFVARSIISFSQHFSFPLSVPLHHCSILIHPSTTHTVQCFSPCTSVSPVSTIPPLLHTHPSIYHPRCIMFLSQHFSFPCQYHSTIDPHPSSSSKSTHHKNRRAKPRNLQKRDFLLV